MMHIHNRLQLALMMILLTDLFAAHGAVADGKGFVDGEVFVGYVFRRPEKI